MLQLPVKGPMAQLRDLEHKKKLYWENTGENWKMQLIFGLGMTLIFGVKNCQIKSLIYEPVLGISNNVVCATSKASDQPAHTRSLIRAFSGRLTIL